MANFTSNTYTMKRKILTFTNKISKQLSKPDRKFAADITYGMLASQSCGGAYFSASNPKPVTLSYSKI